MCSRDHDQNTICLIKPKANPQPAFVPLKNPNSPQMDSVNHLFKLLLLLLTVGLFLPACQQDSPPLPDLGPLQIQARINVVGDYLCEPGPCAGMLSYQMSYQVLDSYEFYGHDLAIKVFSGPPINIGGCNCDSLVYCITLAFPIIEVDSAGFKNEFGPPQQTDLFKDTLGGYVNHTDPRLPPGTPRFEEHVVCAPQDSSRLVFFDLDPGLPPGYNLADAIVKIEGICIVGNVDDTYPDEPQATGAHSDTTSSSPNN